VELPQHVNELVRASKLSHDLPQPFATDGVECFSKVNKRRVEISVLFLALFLELAGGKNHVNRPTTFSEATLTLWQVSILQVLNQTVEKNSGEDLAGDGEKGDSTMIVAGLPVPFLLIEVDDGGILEFLIPHGLEERGQPP
jgi:hypothetical protein